MKSTQEFKNRECAFLLWTWYEPNPCGAPLLEELVLLSSDFNENLNIQSNSLKKLKIGRANCTCFRSVVDEELRICCPNLLSLKIWVCVYGTCLLEVPSVTDVILCFKESCNNVIGHGVTGKDFPPLEMFHQVFRDIRHIEKVALSDLCIKVRFPIPIPVSVFHYGFVICLIAFTSHMFPLS